MNNFVKKLLVHSASFYKLVFGSPTPFGGNTIHADISKEDANALIRNRIDSGLPFMATRFGSGELELLITEHIIGQKNGFLINSKNFISGNIPVFWWDNESLNKKCYNSGIFPASPEIISRFYDEMIKAIKQIDVLGSWLDGEKLFDKHLTGLSKVNLSDLEPYYTEEPWSLALKGKKILVIHPFEDSIRRQYLKRELLFKNQDVLPEFELITLKAVQSIAQNESGFKDWFEALNYMKEKISNTDFDIAIIGCGAYGMPLAAHVKSIGKQAIHLGGATQILFGIKGKRWDDIPAVEALYNQYWTKPLPKETPEEFMKIEDGCYW